MHVYTCTRTCLTNSFPLLLDSSKSFFLSPVLLALVAVALFPVTDEWAVAEVDCDGLPLETVDVTIGILGGRGAPPFSSGLGGVS